MYDSVYATSRVGGSQLVVTRSWEGWEEQRGTAALLGFLFGVVENACNQVEWQLPLINMCNVDEKVTVVTLL